VSNGSRPPAAAATDHAKILRVAIVTPAVNRTAGTEKVLSWLTEDLSTMCDLTLITGSVADTDTSKCKVRLLPTLRFPRLARYVTFLLANTLLLGAEFPRRRPSFDVVLATGGDCFLADVVYAHFSSATYRAMLRNGQVTLPDTTRRQRVRNWHYRLFFALASKIERIIYRQSRTSRIIAVSTATKAEVASSYAVDPSSIVVVPNATDSRVIMTAAHRSDLRRDVRHQYGLSDSAPVLLFVASGDWKRKGLELVLQALAVMRDRSINLLVVGREDLPYYESLAERLGVRSQVTFTGFSSEVERYYAAADVFVYPSRYETFALVVLEASASGLPCVVTRVSGVEERIVDGVNGLFVELDGADIAAKLRMLLDDPSMARRLGMSAKESSRSYSRQRVATSIFEILKEQAL
jgi:UDP-glucose:(heptosyl)LPS alpha-1,3-glucosyltransferase